MNSSTEAGAGAAISIDGTQGHATYDVHWPEQPATAKPDQLYTAYGVIEYATGPTCRSVLWEVIEDARETLEAMGARVVRREAC